MHSMVMGQLLAFPVVVLYLTSFFSCGKARVNSDAIVAVSKDSLVLDLSDLDGNFQEGQQKSIRIYTDDGLNLLEKRMHIMGDTRSLGNKLVFYPLTGFSVDNNYHVFVNGKSTASFSIPSDSESFLVEHIYPKANRLPENILKFYVEFSAPVAPGQAYDQVIIVSDEGDTISNPFVRLTPELWNENFTRITLWVDPGRQKRALERNEWLGSVFESGKEYSLIIKDGWKSRIGSSLAHPVHLKFRIVDPLRKRIDITKWELELPLQGAKSPLVVKAEHQIDYLLLLKHFKIYEPGGSVINGQLSQGPNLDQFEFTPEKAWITGSYAIRCGAALEDLAGNNLNRPFDVDLQAEEVQGDEDFYTRHFFIE